MDTKPRLAVGHYYGLIWWASSFLLSTCKFTICVVVVVVVVGRFLEFRQS